MKILKVLILFLCVIPFLSCRKNTTGGKAQVAGFVEYIGNRIPGATVYIKYGATTSPGTNPSDYDSQQTTDSQGNYTFSTLFPGDYYLFATGYYTTTFGYTRVTGGTHVSIPNRKSSVNYDIGAKP